MGKPKDLATSYRPISLLSPAAKVLERLILPRMAALDLRESQHGFRRGRSTVTALLPLAQQVSVGFNQRRPPDRSLALALDFSRAFDTVPHSKLLSALNLSAMENNTIRWLNSYLRGRFCVAR